LLLLLGILAVTASSRISDSTGDLNIAIRAACLGILTCAVAAFTCSAGAVKDWQTPTLIAFALFLTVLWAGTELRNIRQRKTRVK